MMNDYIHGQISYKWCLPNAFNMKLGYNSIIFLQKLSIETVDDSAVYVIRLANVITTGHAQARLTQLLIIIHRVWMVLKTVEDWRKRRWWAREWYWINVSLDWGNGTDYHWHIDIHSNACLPVKYERSWLFCLGPGMRQICPAELETTDNDHW